MFFEKLQNRKNDGFTLVELIVVIAILAILAGIAVPAYSGYIDKANVAADEQLLHTVNTAFLSACSYKGVDVSSLTSGTAVMPLNAGVVNADGVKPAEATATFKEFYGDNSASAFKTIASLYFDTNTLAFKAGSGAYLSLAGKFNSGDISTFNGSIYSDLGFDALMGKVDLAVLTAMSATDGSTLNSLVFASGNEDALAKYLGFDSKDSEGYDEAFFALIEKKAAMMAPAGTSEEDMYAYYELAEKEILANTAVLVAATNSTFDKDAFKAQLAAGEGKNTIQTSMNTDGGTQMALSQTAMAYGMYTSYIQRTGGTASNDVQEVLNVLASDGFKNYMSNADGGEDEAGADMKGYMAAMNMINSVSSGEDKTPVTNLLVNGFNDPELIAALTQEVSK